MSHIRKHLRTLLLSAAGILYLRNKCQFYFTTKIMSLASQLFFFFFKQNPATKSQVCIYSFILSQLPLSTHFPHYLFGIETS